MVSHCTKKILYLCLINCQYMFFPIKWKRIQIPENAFDEMTHVSSNLTSDLKLEFKC